MERRAFQTPLGEVWLWGEPEAFGGDKPVIFVVLGAFASDKPTCFFDMPPFFPEAAILVAHLPGNHCPELSEVSVEAFALAYDHALATAAPQRPVVLCGVSTGALVTLSMRAPNIKSMVLVEPFLRTAELWPIIPLFRENASKVAWAARFVEAVFGYYPDHIEERDYRPLLSRLLVKAWFLLGEVPLMPERPFSEFPSLMDEPERELIAAHPLARIAVSAGTGHSIPQFHDKLVDAALKKALSQLR